MRLLRAATAALAALLLFAACSDDEPGPDDPMATWTPSVTLEVPSPSATETSAPAPVEPALPDAARKATEDGARAFIEYYWDLVNYAQVTGDVKALRKVSGPNCERCNAGVKAIQDVYRSGGHLTDGHYQVDVVSMKEVSSADKQIYAFESKSQVANAEHMSIDADGKQRTFDASTLDYLLYVLWVDDQWRLDVMTRA